MRASSEQVLGTAGPVEKQAQETSESDRVLFKGESNIAATSEVDELPDGLCPCCGSGFARDIQGIGYRRHLERRPKRDSRGNILRDENGNEVPCGGTFLLGVVVAVIEDQSKQTVPNFHRQVCAS